MEQSDFLRLFTMCADGEKLGFGSKLIEYLKDECPKKDILLASVSDESSLNYFNECFLPLVGQIAH
jgi:hypothetical protein